MNLWNLYPLDLTALCMQQFVAATKAWMIAGLWVGIGGIVVTAATLAGGLLTARLRSRSLAP